MSHIPVCLFVDVLKSICWGPEGTLQGYDELAIREYDSFTFLKDAIEQCGLSKTLQSIGPYTLLAPTGMVG
jgi:uncharacterized surface protein with fasciclin (FAS1) repeats